jgi:hypothetical protein
MAATAAVARAARAEVATAVAVAAAMAARPAARLPTSRDCGRRRRCRDGGRHGRYPTPSCRPTLGARSPRGTSDTPAPGWAARARFPQPACHWPAPNLPIPTPSLRILRLSSCLESSHDDLAVASTQPWKGLRVRLRQCLCWSLGEYGCTAADSVIVGGSLGSTLRPARR